MQSIMKLASLGHSARNQAAIKVRQPLAEVAFSVSSQDEVRALENYADLLVDELNVKQVRALGSTGEAVSYSIKPLPKQLGQKYKSLFPKVSAAIRALQAHEAEAAALTLLSGQSVRVTVEGINLDIQPDEVEVHAEARSGLVVASEGAYLAALKTDLTPELVREGFAREFVRRVQDLRKQAGFDIADRIRLFAVATPDLSQAIQEHRQYIMAETLASEFHLQAPPEQAIKLSVNFDQEEATIGVQKVE